ncbi:MAG TPA: DUF92 domain-containing protein [Vicinamibacterales bacterium]|jgi:uncharacterized protein (TIGR00297 family)
MQATRSTTLVTHAEDRRQVLHMSMAAFALLLRVLTWEEALACALAALLFNLFVLPRVGGRRLFRDADIARGYPAGIVLYPLSVSLLIVLFPTRLDIAAAAWGIMALGDGMATIVGRRFNTRRLPWNGDKTVGGLLAFIISGAIGGTLLALWVRPGVSPVPSLLFAGAAPAFAAIAAGFAESIPIRLDDNISVPAIAALILWSISLASIDISTAHAAVILRLAGIGLLANLAAGWIGWRLRTVSVPGAIAGVAIGTIVYAGAGPGAWGLLMATFICAAVCSRLGVRRKRLLGIAQERGGRRGPGNAIANCGVAAGAALLVACSGHTELARLALVIAFAAAGSDTAASEIGKAWGRHPFLFTRGTFVPAGTSGAMSLEGTAAGLLAAFGLAAIGVAAVLVPWAHVWVVVVAATAGSFVESVLGATLEASGTLNNDALNFLNTAAAVAVGLVLAVIA